MNLKKNRFFNIQRLLMQILMSPSPFFQQATKEFVEKVNELRRSRNVGPLSWNTAVKFLMARKFDVSR